jgi:thiol-disulfide isomerase/thioredoxin
MSPNARQRSVATAARRQRTRWWLWGVLAAVVVLAVVVAVVSGGGGDAKATPHETASVKVEGTPLPQYAEQYNGTDADPAIGKTIPTLQGTSVLTGDPVTIGPNGKPQAVVFVAHWCPHCQREVPRIVALAKSGAFKGLDITAVATGTNPQYPNYPPSAWLKSVAWPFSVMADSKTGTAAQAYGLDAYPYFVLVNADGKVAGRATGEVSDADIKANVNALIAGEPLPLLKSGASSSSSAG